MPSTAGGHLRRSDDGRGHEHDGRERADDQRLWSYVIRANGCDDDIDNIDNNTDNNTDNNVERYDRRGLHRGGLIVDHRGVVHRRG